MGKLLTKSELATIESTIDEISARADSLDPSNPAQSEILDSDNAIISELISTLEQSHRLTRIKESGLRLIQ